MGLISLLSQKISEATKTQETKQASGAKQDQEHSQKSEASIFASGTIGGAVADAFEKTTSAIKVASAKAEEEDKPDPSLDAGDLKYDGNPMSKSEALDFMLRQREAMLHPYIAAGLLAEAGIAEETIDEILDVMGTIDGPLESYEGIFENDVAEVEDECDNTSRKGLEFTGDPKSLEECTKWMLEQQANMVDVYTAFRVLAEAGVSERTIDIIRENTMPEALEE